MQLDLHPKNVRVAIVLVTLALCAFFLAQGATRFVASKWLPAAAPTPASTSSEVEAPEPPKGKQPPSMTAILARNIFDSATGALWPPKPPDSETTEATGEGQESAVATTLAPGEMPPPCEGQVRLVASIYSERLPHWSFASLAFGSESPLLYRPGTAVDSKVIDSIYPEAVFLKTSNGALCSLTLFKSATPAPPKKPSTTPPAPSVAPATAGAGISESELDQSIQQVSETKYNVQRSLIDKVLQNQAELIRSARVVPHEENGRVVGVKLYGIRRSSLLGKLGLQNGDLLRTVNGFDMASPDSALEAYTKLRSASNLAVAVTRRGSAVTMEYQVGN